MSEARAWVGCLACYNDGRLIGKWLDGSELHDFEQMTWEAKHKTLDPRVGLFEGWGTYNPHEEFWVMDHEGLGVKGECSPAAALERMELIDIVEEKFPMDEAVAFWLYVDDNHIEGFADIENALFDFEDVWAGWWSSKKEFAQQSAEDIGALKEDNPWPYDHIDWDGATRDLMYDYTVSDYVENLGYAIWRNA